MMPKSKIAKDALRVIRRWPSPQQGRALEVIGHAIDYLTDMYVSSRWPHLGDYNANMADLDALQLLQRHSMSIFNECTEIVPSRIARVLGGCRTAIGGFLLK
jgi:hypothetical protein